ncbi:MAG: ADP-ribosylglycohydrolase family protein [Methanosarcinaceae archaeon]|nr:ADP-ribosylglycohydrolase family protein [Methanosarcinaceae archaeon]
MNNHQIETIERYRGSLLGLAVGDALGAPLEGRPPGTFEPVEEMIGGGVFGLEPGQWTDDTTMALCLAESLIKKKGFYPLDQLERYLRWHKEGHLSSTGKPFGIGVTTHGSLHRFEDKHDPISTATAPWTATNGSLMRVAPVPLAFVFDPVMAIEKAGESSRTTHGSKLAVDACRYMGALIVGAVQGATKEELISEHYSPVAEHWEKHPLCPEIDEIAAGSFKKKEPPGIQGTGYVIRSLEAALWAFNKSTCFKDGCLLAVNLGDDADTTGAVYGQLAGAFYGEQKIPNSWLSKIAHRKLIESYAEKLMVLAGLINTSVGASLTYSHD